MQHEEKLIILKVLKFRESDLIVHGLSQTGERLNFLARGALRSKKRFAGGMLEPLNYLKVSYSQKSSDDELKILQEASLIDDFNELRSHYDRLELALYFLQVMAKVSKEGVTNSNNFNLLGNALRLAQSTEDINRLRTIFEIKLLHFQGVLPPDLSQSEWLAKPIRDYMSIKAEPAKWQGVRHRVHHVLESFLR